jgi:hypothetical protein
MRKLVIATLVFVTLVAGLAFVITVTKAQETDSITITLDKGRKVVNVSAGGKGYNKQLSAPPTVNTTIPPLNLVVFFNNPPGCVYIPNTGEWWC